MEFISWLFFFIGVVLYLKIVRQARTPRPETTPEKIIEDKLLVIFIFLLGVSVTGLQYCPPLEAANTPLMGIGLTTLGVSVVLAIPMCIYMGMSLQSHGFKSARSVAYLSSFVLVIINAGVFLLLNSALDLKPSQRLQVQVTRKEYSAGGSKVGPTYRLYVEELRNPTRQLRLLTESDIYDKAAHGSKLQLEIGSGLFGVAWVKNLQLD